MGCGCSSCNSGYTSCSPTCCVTPSNLSCVSGGVVIVSSWNVPSCDANATLSVTGLKNIMIGAYLYNPSYGYFKIEAFNAVTGELSILNECQAANAAPGTTVPAYTTFSIGTPPNDIGWTDWTPTFTPTAPMTMSGTTILQAEYAQNVVTKTVMINVYATTTTAGVASNVISMTLPVNISGANSYLVGLGQYESAATFRETLFVERSGSSSTLVTLVRTGSANYAIGAITLKFSGTYIGV